MGYRTTIYITDAQMFTLQDLAKEEGTSVSAVCRNLLDRGILEHMLKIQYRDLKQEIASLKELLIGGVEDES